jgi:PAS domain S-box-containing protein
MGHRGQQKRNTVQKADRDQVGQMLLLSMLNDGRRIEVTGESVDAAPHDDLRRRLHALSAFAERAYADARSLAEHVPAVLVEALSLDLAYLRLDLPTTMAVASAPGRSLKPDEVTASGAALEPALSDRRSASVCRIPGVSGGVDLRVDAHRIGERGVVVGAARRADFPTALERELFALAVKLVAAGLERVAAEGAQRRQNAQRAVAQVFASARTTAEAASGILRAVCENLEWGVGAIWIPDARSGELRCAGFWHSPALTVPHFEAMSRERTFRSGVGLPGRVWSSGRPVWIPEVTRDENFPRAAVASRDGLHAAFGFPIRLGEQILGAIEFFSERIREPDEDLLAMMTTVGLHLGQFLDRSRANEILLESEERFARFMHHIPGLAWLKDRDGRYVYANDKAVEVFRTPRARLYGRRDEDIFPPETAAQFRENDRKALASPTGMQAIETLQHADGVVHQSLATKFPVADPDGAPAMVGGIALDITDQLRTAEAFRESEERLALAVHEAGMATWDVDVLTGNAVWSETHFRILGYEPVPGGAASHEMVLARIHPDDSGRVIDTLNEARRRQTPYRLEYRIIRADNGEVRWLSAFGRFRQSARERFVGVMFDNTDRRRAEDAQGSRPRKDEFLALLAHELRNPLAPIRNASHLLRIGSREPAEIDRIQRVLERQVQHMVRLVDDLLEVSRISRGRLELRVARVDLKSVATSAIETTRPIIDASRHRLTIELPAAPVPVRADAVRLTQVLANLLHNATKYTPEGGHIILSVQPDGDHALIRVRDTGIGIPASLLTRIFGMFSQGDSLAGRSESGLGIGLTIAKSLVELHGGTIEARSDGPGRGAEFAVRLPLIAAEEVPAGTITEAPLAPPFPGGCRVLIVEDNRDAGDSLALILRREGMDAQIATDGEAALGAIAASPPDVILLDIAMPGMDGYEVARRVRQRPELDRVTLVALTGFAQEADRERCREAGFDHHLVKPVDPDVLQALLASIASRPAGGDA